MQIILSAFSDMVVNAEGRVDRELFLSGQGFIGFCEYWIGHCERVSMHFLCCKSY
jgi:separase